MIRLASVESQLEIGTQQELDTRYQLRAENFPEGRS